MLTQAAVLFNLGALQSQIALQTERSSDAGVKDAAKLFQVRSHPPTASKLLTASAIVVASWIRV